MRLKCEKFYQKLCFCELWERSNLFFPLILTVFVGVNLNLYLLHFRDVIPTKIGAVLCRLWSHSKIRPKIIKRFKIPFFADYYVELICIQDKFAAKSFYLKNWSLKTPKRHGSCLVGPGIGHRCLSYSFQTFAHVISRILVSVTIYRIILVFQTEVYYGIIFSFRW